MKILYLCFVSNGFDDQYVKLAYSSMSAKEFVGNMAREYLKASASVKDATSPYTLAVDLETLQVKTLGAFKLDKEGKLYRQVWRGEFSGKAETPEDLEEDVRRRLSE
jgi:hypothetical protein